MCIFWSGMTSCPNFKFPLRFKPISCCCVDILIFGGTWGIFQEASFLFQGGGVGLQLSQIESQESAVAHRVFLPLLVSSIKSLCQRHPPNFTERKKIKNLQIGAQCTYPHIIDASITLLSLRK